VFQVRVDRLSDLRRVWMWVPLVLSAMNTYIQYRSHSPAAD
jgi:hypothetical protein